MSPFAATPAMNVSSNVKIHPFALSPTMPPLATASGRTASAAIGQIVAMKTATSMSRRKCRVDTTNPTSSSIATNPNTLPWRDASPAAGALNSTSATPPNARTANTSARASLNSPKSQAPIGTMRNGASDPIRAALATLLCVAPAKKTARFRPKNTPGTTAWRTFGSGDPPSGGPEVHVEHDGRDGQPPERNEHTRRLGALHERRAQREADDDTDNREGSERARSELDTPRFRHTRHRIDP